MDLMLPVVLGVIAIRIASGIRAAMRREFVNSYAFPAGVQQRLRKAHPRYTAAQIADVIGGLRDWFLVAQRAKRRPVSMPSRIVDDAWHEFIIDTRAYREFCRRAFGHPFDHVPAEAMRSPLQAQEGIRRAWRLACALEWLDARRPTRLPRLFALDARLAVPGGFVYAIDCMRGELAPHCASAIGCTSGCGSGCGGDGGCGGGCGGD